MQAPEVDGDNGIDNVFLTTGSNRGGSITDEARVWGLSCPQRAPCVPGGALGVSVGVSTLWSSSRGLSAMDRQQNENDYGKFAGH